MTNRVIVPIILECLRELADINYQRSVWTASSGPEISSFTEAVCGLYNDSGLRDELDRSRTVFSTVIDVEFAYLGRKLSEIDSDRDPLEVIEDPKMEQIRLLARKLLERLTREGIS